MTAEKMITKICGYFDPDECMIYTLYNDADVDVIEILRPDNIDCYILCDKKRGECHELVCSEPLKAEFVEARRDGNIVYTRFEVEISDRIADVCVIKQYTMTFTYDVEKGELNYRYD